MQIPHPSGAERRGILPRHPLGFSQSEKQSAAAPRSARLRRALIAHKNGGNLIGSPPSIFISIPVPTIKGEIRMQRLAKKTAGSAQLPNPPSIFISIPIPTIKGGTWMQRLALLILRGLLCLFP